MSINQAHLIHDHSTGRSSTRLHAPPGGKSSMGTSFGWTEDEPPKASSSGRGRNAPFGIEPTPAAQPILPPRRGLERDFQQAPPAPEPVSNDPFGPSSAGGRTGFGDSGQSCVKIHEPAGGRSAMGSSFGWDNPSTAGSSGRGDAVANARLQQPAGAPTGTPGIGPGSIALYKGVGCAVGELVEVLSVEPTSSRKDNYRVRFADGRERQTTADKLALAPTGGGGGGAVAGLERGMRDMDVGSPGEAGSSTRQAPGGRSSLKLRVQGTNLGWENAPAASPPSPQRPGPPRSADDSHDTGFGDSGRSSVRIHSSPGGNASMGSSFGWGNQAEGPAKKGDFVDNRIGGGLAKGSSAGELAVGEKVIYRQTLRSDPVEALVLDLELPSTNGAMRTKTYYTLQFADGSTRQTTIDKISRLGNH